MSRDVIDNRTLRLVDRVEELLQAGCIEARFAVGYLFLDGLIPLTAAILRLREMRFLIGNIVSRVPDDQIQRVVDSRVRGGEEWVRDQEDVASSLRTQHDRLIAEATLNLRRTIDGLPRTGETRALLLALAGRIADGGLKIRLFSTERIHAKVSLLYYPEGAEGWPGVAVVGSSNLTMAAPSQATELSVVVREKEAVQEIEKWYQAAWSNAQDFQRELFDELGRSWAVQAA